MKIGYARVSSTDQDLAVQRESWRPPAAIGDLKKVVRALTNKGAGLQATEQPIAWRLCRVRDQHPQGTSLRR
jgi:DNA invertase Pin-like site-specific DNA recombinase